MTDCIKKIRSLFYLAVLAVFMACGAAEVSTTLEEDLATNETPKIAFVSYKLTKDANGKVSMSFIDLIMAEGRLKLQEDKKVYVAGDYEVVQLDSRGKQLAFQKIANPLNQTIEFVDDDGALGKKEVAFPSKEVTIRLQLHSKTEYILMQEIGNESINFVKTKL